MAVIKIRRKKRDRDGKQKRARGEAPSNEAPSTKAPFNEEPSTKAPSNEEPSTKAPSNGEPSNEAPSNKWEWDNVCAICDDGGELLCCEGGCLRSFHPTKEHGENSICKTLELTKTQWQILKPNGDEENTATYICENCSYKQHQCFACGLLGSSDLSSGSKVFQCKDQKCGHFYHPQCVAKLLYPDSKTQAFHFKQDVASGLEFLCPMHKCGSCKQAENKDDKKMQFAVCRRCPTAYHRKCLPSDIPFEDNETEDTPRAWDDILPDRILMYCTKHKIEPELSTPKRDHIVFPERDLSPKRAKGAPKEQDIPDHPLSGPSQSSQSSQPSQSPQPPQPAETGQDRPKPIDSFEPKHLFPHPQPGSCGCLDE